MRLVVRNKLSVAFAAALLGVVANAAVAHRNALDLAETTRRVARSHEVQDALERLLSTVKDAETGQRGYFITADPDYLAPYTEAVAEVQRRLRRVRELTGDLPNHRERLAEVGRLTDAKLAELAHTIVVYRENGPEAARAAVKAGHGKRLMDGLREVVGAMQEDEGRQLHDREAAAAASLRRAWVMNLIGGSLGVGLVGLAVYLFRRDLHAREAAAADLRRANEELEQRVAERTAALQRSNNELGQFASVASHDLQEPLRKVQAFGDRLAAKAADLDDVGRDYVQRMLAAAARMRTLINDLLAYSRVTTKAKPPEPVDLAAVARDVVCDLEGRLQQTGGRVEVGELPVVTAEPTQMRQLLQNLIGNALKFHKPGEPPVVHVTARVLANGAAGDGPPRAEVAVADNGIGFDEKYLDRIFAVFQRLHGRGEFEGTGVGLAICRKIAEQHGGAITARSAPGGGSTFVVTLPLSPPAPKESP